MTDLNLTELRQKNRVAETLFCRDPFSSQWIKWANQTILSLIERVERAEAREPFSASQPLTPDRIDRMARWCQAHYETTCLSGAAGLDMLKALSDSRRATLEEAAEECDAVASCFAVDGERFSAEQCAKAISAMKGGA